MGLKLVLLRHGEAAIESYGQSDVQRHLTPRGREQAKGVSEFLVKLSMPAMFAHVSPARRTMETFELLESQLFASVETPSVLYSGGAEDLRDVLLNRDDEDSACLVVGHNPTLSWYAESLLYRSVLFAPSGCLVLESSQSSWGEALYSRWELSDKNAQIQC